MSTTTIFKLNNYCLYEIFRQIKINCEVEHDSQNSRSQVNYWDLIYFAISFEKFVEAFQEWDSILYNDLHIELAFLEDTNSIKIDLVEIYDLLQNLPKRDKEIYWALHVNAIKENKRINRFQLKYKPNKFYPEHLDRIQALMNVIRHKNTLKELTIHCNGYSFENVPQLGELKSLSLNVRMDAEDLVQLCRSNPHLSFLSFTNTELYGRFTDILPYCNQLVHLRLTMKADASEYAALSKLPKLEILQLRGNHKEGTLKMLFQGLKNMSLSALDIPNTLLNIEETDTVMKIESLSQIWCGFSDIAYLANLSTPNQIKLYAKPGQIILMDHLINVVKNSVLHIEKKDSPRLSIEFIEEHEKLVVDLRFSSDKEVADTGLSNIANHITRTVELLNVAQLSLSGDFNEDMLKTIFQCLASQQPQILRKLYIPQRGMIKNQLIPLSLELASTLASIRSLTTIASDIQNLEQVIAMKVMQLNGITETETATRVDRIKTEECEISVLQNNNNVTLVLDIVNVLFNIDVLAPLASLSNLKILIIRMNTFNDERKKEYRSFIRLIKLIKNLQELEIEELDCEDLIELSQVRGLKVLKCGFDSFGSFEHLAELNLLESLTITTHNKGSLRTLFNALASKEDQVLQSLSVQETGLTSEEIFQLVGITSLEILQLGLPTKKKWENKYKNVSLKASSAIETPFNLELIANLPKLKELSIYFDYEREAVDKVLRALTLPSPQRMILLSLPTRDIRLISQFQELRCLECFVYQMEDVKYLTILGNLTELQIHNPLKSAMWELLKELNTLSSLQSLHLDDTELEFLDVVELTKINWLTRLRLGFAEKQFIIMLTQLENLEVLEITSTHYAEEDEINFCVQLIESCSNLISISLYQYDNLIQKSFYDAIWKSIRRLRNPEIHAPIKLRVNWTGIYYVDKLNNYNDAYLKLEGFLDSPFLPPTF